jgi:mannose-1-phosphate guanylyltransferase/mannose-6-phosphate isomerase
MLIHPVLLSGGSGTRLWPLSRALHPKQLLPLLHERSLLQDTALRFAGRPFAPPIVLCNEAHRFVIAEQLRAIDVKPHRIVLEPIGRNTAPAAAIAALMVAESDPNGLLLMTPSDHRLGQPERLIRAIEKASPLAASGTLVTFGVEPTRPHTGYGYIKMGAPLAPGVHAVEAFVEKPERALAERYVESGDYLWNSGIFLFAANAYLGELGRLRPAMLARCREALSHALPDLDFLRLAQRAFGAIDGESIDYAVMEHTSGAAVAPIDAGWSDVGSFATLREVGAQDPAGNVLTGDVVQEACHDSYLRSDGRLLVALGLKDMVAVASQDAVLIAPLERADEIGKIVARLKSAGRREVETHPMVERPWGSYEDIRSGPGYKVKLLRVKPKAALSLQYHNRRAEHWVVVGGQARVLRGAERLELGPDQSLYVPAGTPHRLENPGDVMLDVIEVQTGSYLEEDDIVRLEDRYGRVADD